MLLFPENGFKWICLGIVRLCCTTLISNFLKSRFTWYAVIVLTTIVELNCSTPVQCLIVSENTVLLCQ
jgi:hypothetical protein